MSNNKLTDRKIAEILARAEICDDLVLTDYTDIAAAMRELQERRRLDGIQHAVCEVCGVPCNNPNHPLKRGELFKIDLQLIQDNQKRHNGELFKIKSAVV